MTAPASKQYKRSWKNLLLNKRYQLRFTLFMVGLSAVLMAGLGVWVMKEANETTTIAMAQVHGAPCAKVPVLTDTGADDDDNSVPMKLDGAAPNDGDVGSAAAAEPAPIAPAPAPTPSAVDPRQVAKHNAMKDVITVANIWCVQGVPCVPARTEPLVIKAPHCDAWVKDKLADPAAVAALRAALIPIVKCDGGQTFSVADAPMPEHHVSVQIDESSMTLTPTVPANYADMIVDHWKCELGQSGALDQLERGRLRILWVLIATGLVLIMGLAVYGIKMTHKVAGPLFKVSLYLAKMRDGRFDKVWNLRKGDQLVEFYDHFRAAHAGVVKAEREDIDHIKAVIAAAETAGAGDHESVKELRTLLERKEKALE